MEHVIKVTTTGTDANATGSASSEVLVRGYLEAVQYDYHADAPDTTDVTLTEASSMARTLLTVSNNKTDTVKYPRVALHDTSGTALTLDGTEPATGRLYLPGVKVTVAVAGCNALTDAVVARLLVSEV